jgi:tetratricopeptide (TPR) repeat protein
MVTGSVPDGLSSRRIFTLSDAARVLSDPASLVSFTECLDCIELASDSISQNERNQARFVRDEAVKRGISIFNPKNIHNSQFPIFVSASVSFFLSKSASIDTLPENIVKAEKHVSGLQHIGRSQNLRGKHLTAINQEIRHLSELSLLLAETTALARVRLSSKLRHPFYCQDLAIDACNRALAERPKDVAALTSRAAAFLDNYDRSAAKKDLKNALRINERNTPTLVVVVHYLAAEGDFEKALEYALKAVSICEEIEHTEDTPQSALTSYRYALSSVLSVATQDRDLREEVALKIGALDKIAGQPTPYFFLLAVEQTIKIGDFLQAELLLNEVMGNQTNLNSGERAQVKSFRSKIKRWKQRNQGRLDI